MGTGERQFFGRFKTPRSSNLRDSISFFLFSATMMMPALAAASEPVATAPRSLLDLGQDCIVACLRQCRIPDILRFSEVCHGALDSSSDDCIWKPLYEARRWTTPHTEQVSAGKYRNAYRMAARAESPLVLQFAEFRALVGFARDGVPVAAALRSDASVDHTVAAAVAAAGLGGGYSRPLQGADVVLVASICDTIHELEPILRGLFARGAKRVRICDAAVMALRFVGGQTLRTGTVLFLDYVRVAAACIVDGHRVPPRRRDLTFSGVQAAVEGLVEDVLSRPLPPAPTTASAPTASASAASGVASRPAVPSPAPAASTPVPSAAQLVAATCCAIAGAAFDLPEHVPPVPLLQVAADTPHRTSPRATVIEAPPSNPSPRPAAGTAAGTASGTAAGTLADPLLVLRLREMTGANPARCEEALQRHQGQADAAALWLLSEATEGTTPSATTALAPSSPMPQPPPASPTPPSSPRQHPLRPLSLAPSRVPTATAATAAAAAAATAAISLREMMNRHHAQVVHVARGRPCDRGRLAQPRSGAVEGGQHGHPSTQCSNRDELPHLGYIRLQPGCMGWWPGHRGLQPRQAGLQPVHMGRHGAVVAGAAPARAPRCRRRRPAPPHARG